MEPVSNVPSCDPSETITQVDMEAAYAKGKLLGLRYVYLGEEGGFLKVILQAAPDRELFLSTRRDRTRPRIFVDQNALFAYVKGLLGQVTARVEVPAPSPTPADKPA